MTTCYIVGAGSSKVEFTPDASDFVIAADGGYDTLRALHIRCDLLVGDMDSIKDVPENIDVVRHPVRKNETDMHLAYLEGRDIGYDRFVILGAVGGRADHTFANYSLLLKIANDGCDGMIIHDTGTARVIKNRKICLSGEKEGDHLSVFAIGGVARGVSIKGAEYECTHLTLTPDFPMGVSNSFVGKDTVIGVEDGALLILTEKKRG